MRIDGTPGRRHRRPRGRPVLLTLCVCGDHGPGVQDPARTHQEAPGGAFWFQLARRLSGVHPDVLEALALEGPQDRAERLLELSSDLSDLLLRHEAGGVGEALIRSAALDVASEAASVWAATCGLPLDATDARLDAGVGW